MSFARFRILRWLAVAATASSLAVPAGAAAAAPGQPLPGFTPLEQRFGPAGGSETATGVAIRHDGRIVVSSANDSEFDRRIVGLTATGQLDTTFSDDGVWHMPMPSNDTIVRAVATMPDGKVVFAGDDGSQQAIVIGRLMKDGELDPTFGGGDGLYVFGTGTGTSPWVEEVLVQSDGKVVFAGSVTDPTKGRQLFIGRLDADGTDDDTFQGLPFTKFGSVGDGVDDRLAGLARMPNGEFIAGSSHAAGSSGFVRIGPTGNYFVVKDLNIVAGADSTVDLVPVDATHVMAIATSGDAPTLLARLDVADTPKLDVTFDGDGVKAPFPASFSGLHLVRQTDGKLVVAGFDTAGGSHRAIARLTATGTLDPTFGGGGVQPLAGAASHATLLRAHEVALTAEGGIVSASHVGEPGSTVTAVERLVGRQARLRAEVLAPAAAPIAGQSATVTLRVHNDGPDAAGATKLTFSTSPELLVESSVGPCAYSTTTSGWCEFADLAPGVTDVTLQVRSAAAGMRSVSMSVDGSTYDDVTGDDSSILMLSVGDAPAAAAAAAIPPKAPAITGRRNLVLGLRRLTWRAGRVQRCGFSRRLACTTARIAPRRRTTATWLRAFARPAPGNAKGTVNVVLQRWEGRRFVKRGSGTIDLGADGRITFELPRDMRHSRSLWRMQVWANGTRTTKFGRSPWFYVRVR